MQKWEYLRLLIHYTGSGSVDEVRSNGRQVSINPNGIEASDYLNKLGGDGWELVNSIAQGNPAWEAIYLKRPIK